MRSTLPMSTDRSLGRLLTWFSPAFPVGGYSYSHGLEFAVEAGMVMDSAALRQWIDTILRFGAGRADAILLGEAWRAEAARDDARLADALAWGEAFRGTSELALESAAQGAAFLAAVRAAWPHPRLDGFAKLALENDREPAYAVVVGVACAAFGIDEDTARFSFLQAFAANLVSAGVRLIPLGQSDGLRVLAALEATVRNVAEESAGLDLSHLGTSTWVVDWCSALHETQYTRLFRS
jgi:urease accessory protein